MSFPPGTLQVVLLVATCHYPIGYNWNLSYFTDMAGKMEWVFP